MTAKVYNLQDHRAGKAVAPVVTTASAPAPAITPRERHLLIQSISYLLKKANFSNEDRLMVLTPVILPPEYKDYPIWKHNARLALQEEFGDFPDWLKSL